MNHSPTLISTHNGTPFEAYVDGDRIELVFSPGTNKEFRSSAEISAVRRDPDAYLWTPFVQVVLQLPVNPASNENEQN